MPKKKKAKRIAKKPEHEEEFYVGVRDPAELKHNLLESSRDLVQYIQRLEKIQQIREKKKAQIEHLRTAFRSIITNTNKLKKHLPKTNLRIKLQKEAKPEKKAYPSLPKKAEKPVAAVPKMQKREMPKAPPAPEQTELERLERELSEIEGRLTKLS